MAISPVAASAAASGAQANAAVAVAQAKAANQQSLVDTSSAESSNPVTQAPAVKPSLNSNGETIGTTISVSA